MRVAPPAMPPIGHALRQVYPVPGMWRALCECTVEFRAPTQQAAEDHWEAHIDEIRQERWGP